MLLSGTTMRPRINYFLAFLLPLLGSMATLGAAEGPRYEYRLLATAKTSTMEKELNEAGEAGRAGAVGPVGG